MRTSPAPGRDDTPGTLVAVPRGVNAWKRTTSLSISGVRVMDTIGGMVFERFVKPTFFGQATDEARVQTILRDELPPAFDWLESQIHPERDTILPHFSVADAALGPQLASLGAAGESIDARRWPRLSRYAEALWARPSFVRSAPR